MQYVTPGGVFYPDRHIPVWCNRDEGFSGIQKTGNRYSIILILKGSNSATLNGRPLLLVAPSMLCLDENDVLSMDSCENMKAKTLLFHPSFINQKLNLDNVREGKQQLELTDRQDAYLLSPFVERSSGYLGHIYLDPLTAHHISAIFDRFEEECMNQQDWYWPCRARSFLLELLFCIERILPQLHSLSLPLPHTTGKMGPIVRFLNTNYPHKLTVGEISNRFHVNRTTLQEQFREATGHSIIEYLIKLRVSLAVILLRDTEIVISEIVERLGFNDSSHFSRTFRQHTGYSPTEYRKEFCVFYR